MEKKITLALVLSCLTAGSVSLANGQTLTGDQTISTPLTSTSYTVSGDKASVTNTSGYVMNGGSISLGENQELTLTANGGGNIGVITGTTISGQGTINLVNNSGNGLGTGTNMITADTIHITAKSGSNKGITGNGTTTLKAKTITIQSDDDAIHFTGGSSGQIEIKDFDSLTLQGGEEGYAIQNASSHSGSLTIKGNDNSTINLISGLRSAIEVQNKTASVSIYGGEVNIHSLYPGATVNVVSGTLDLTANNKLVIKNESTSEFSEPLAIAITDESKFNLHTNDNTVVQITGSISLARNSGTFALDLNGKDSFLEGGIYRAYLGNDADSSNPELTLRNGAVWNNIYKSKYTTNSSYVGKLTMDGGIIKQNDTKVITIDKFKGSGTISFLGKLSSAGTESLRAGDTGSEGVLDLSHTGKVIINDAEQDSNISVGVHGVTNVDTSDKEKLQDTLNEIAGNIEYKGDNDNLEGKVEVSEGILSSAVSADMNFNKTGDSGSNSGTIDMDSIQLGDKETSTMKHMRDITSVALLAWRQEDSTLSQRLGDLRGTKGDQGFWTRMSRGEFEYDGAFKNQYNFFQLGYDKAYGNWHYGAAISHNDGSTTYDVGYGDNASTSLSLYGTWQGENGQYVDVVLKEGKLSNEFTNYAEAGVTTGDYDMWGTSISAEYGHKVDLHNDWYITPQAQVTYMRIGGEDYTADVKGEDTNTSMQVSQDSLNSLVGRIGFETGKHFGDRGNFYLKASLLHEFDGEADTYLSMYGVDNQYTQDLGDTWYECGLGVNYKTSDTSSLYVDVMRTFGGDVETPWQWNVGMRWGF